MLRMGLLTLCLAGFSVPASAETMLSVSLNLAENGRVTTVEYSCGDQGSYRVRYINTGDNDLALIPIDGEDRIFVNVVSGSGSRYVSGEYEWWGKGNNATLTDQLEEGSELSCVSQNEASQN